MIMETVALIYAGFLRKQNVGFSQQNQEFSIQNEDFPALPGYKGALICQLETTM